MSFCVSCRPRVVLSAGVAVVRVVAVVVERARYCDLDSCCWCSIDLWQLLMVLLLLLSHVGRRCDVGDDADCSQWSLARHSVGEVRDGGGCVGFPGCVPFRRRCSLVTLDALWGL